MLLSKGLWALLALVVVVGFVVEEEGLVMSLFPRVQQSYVYELLVPNLVECEMETECRVQKTLGLAK